MRRPPHPDLTKDFRYGHYKRWEREGSLVCIGLSITQPDAWRWLAFDASDGCLRGCGYEPSFVRAAAAADEAVQRATMTPGQASPSSSPASSSTSTSSRSRT